MLLPVKTAFTSEVATHRTIQVIKISVFWGMTPLSLTQVYRCLGGTYCPIFRAEEEAK
jgi:hypothetical protein